jgi:hypothetical protein
MLLSGDCGTVLRATMFKRPPENQRRTTSSGMMNRPGRLVALAGVIVGNVGLGGCRTGHTTGFTVLPSVVQRSPVYLDSTGLAKRTGQVRVAVRAVARPTENLGDALVSLIDAQNAVVARSNASATATAVFPQVPVGQYRLRVQRIGYDMLEVVVPVSAGCTADVEAYLALQFIGLDAVEVVPSQGGKTTRASPAPSVRVTGGRATVTVCADDV